MERQRRKWAPRTVNYMLGLLTAVLADQMRQGKIIRNVATLVDRIPRGSQTTETFTPGEAQTALD